MNNEKSAVMTGLLVLFALTVISLVIPGVGVVLLVLVLIGIAAIVTAGVGLLWTTRYNPPTDDEIRVHRVRHDAVMAHMELFERDAR